MKKKLPPKTKKDSSRQGRTVTKDNAGHIIEKLYGFHIISPDDIEHHSGASAKKSGGINQKTESSGEAKSEDKKKKSNDDSNSTE